MITKRALFLVLTVGCVMLYAQPKTLYQFLEDWPAGYDTTGKHWVVYNLNKAKTHFVTESSVSSQTTTSLWMAQIGNFNGGVNPWNPGDTLIAFGSIDTAYISDPPGYGDNPNHCGFYWLFSDTITSATPEAWQPADTLRVMPMPIAAQVGGLTGNIEISITNPVVTTSGIITYDVLGYWLWADTTSGTYYGTPGRPGYFDKEVGFFPVQGGSGETTVCIDPVSNYRDGQTVYWAYKLVAVPDTSAEDSRQVCPGYVTYYFSQNSNPLVIIGIEESQILNPQSRSANLEIYPNPSHGVLRIAYGVGRSESIELKIYNATGCLVKQFTQLLNDQLLNNQVVWFGDDVLGRQVSAGVYFIRFEAEGFKKIEKAVLLR
jgi:hypothetical protein